MAPSPYIGLSNNPIQPLEYNAPQAQSSPLEGLTGTLINQKLRKGESMKDKGAMFSGNNPWSLLGKAILANEYKALDNNQNAVDERGSEDAVVGLKDFPSAWNTYTDKNALSDILSFLR